MTRVELELPDDLYRSFVSRAEQAGRKPTDVMRAALQQYDAGQPKQKKLSILDIPRPRSLGGILKPWTTRAELLEDFLDDRH